MTMNPDPSTKRRALSPTLRRSATVAFFFFLAKGMVWIAAAAGVMAVAR